MAKQRNWEQHRKIALEMLEPSAARENRKLHPDLKKVLDEANELCKNAGEAMISRQAIACLIIDFKQRNPAINPLIEV